MVRISTFVKNLFYILFGQFSSFFFNFATITLIARYWGVTEFGKFGFWLAFSTIASKVIDFGFAPIVFRELSKDHTKTSLLSTSLFIRLIGFVFILCLFTIYAFVEHLSGAEMLIAYLLLLNIITSFKYSNIRELLETPFKVHFKMDIPSQIILLENVLLLASTVYIIHFRLQPIYFYIAYSLTNVPGFAILLYLLKKRYNVKFQFTIAEVKPLFITSMALYAFIVLNILFQQIDVILLRKLSSAYELGIYSAATRLSIPMMIIPTAVISAITPILTPQLQKLHNWEEGGKKGMDMIKATFKVFFIVPVLLAVLFTFNHSSLVRMVFGAEYIASGIATVFLLWAMVLYFHSFFSLNLLVMIEKERWSMPYGIILFLVDFVCCMIILVPYGAFGAAIAKLVAILVGFVFTCREIKKHFLSFMLPSVNALIWVGVSSVLAFITSFLPAVIYVALNVSGSVVLLFLCNVFSEEEITVFFTSLGLGAYARKIALLNAKVRILS